jgi:hypothetical protein
LPASPASATAGKFDFGPKASGIKSRNHSKTNRNPPKSPKNVEENYPVYTSQAQDDVDQMLVKYLLANKVKVPIKRLQESKYLFGTKVIIASIFNEV